MLLNKYNCFGTGKSAYTYCFSYLGQCNFLKKQTFSLVEKVALLCICLFVRFCNISDVKAQWMSFVSYYLTQFFNIMCSTQLFSSHPNCNFQYWKDCSLSTTVACHDNETICCRNTIDIIETKVSVSCVLCITCLVFHCLYFVAVLRLLYTVFSTV